jgi:tetratricopeptide (TPR) repeat protein
MLDQKPVSHTDGELEVVVAQVEVEKSMLGFFVIDEFAGISPEAQPAAEALYHRALARLDEPGADDHATRIDALEGLGSTLSRLGRFADAEQLLRQALTLAEGEYGSQHSRLVPVLTSLGIALDGQGPPGRSAELHRRALDITREHRGDDHTITLALRNNLAIALGVAGAFRDGRGEPAAPFPVAGIGPDPRTRLAQAGSHVARAHELDALLDELKQDK